MRANHGLTKVWLRVGVAAVAAVVVASASGGLSTGKITTIAGTGKRGFSGDGGPATRAQLGRAHGVAVDRRGNVYIADFDNRRVRKVSPSGAITTFAGTGNGTGGGVRLGDGGPATSAALDGPYAVAVDGRGNVYIADYSGGRVRKVNPAGTITTFAGTGKTGPYGDGGPATSAGLYAPSGVAVDGKGNVYIVDSYHHRVRKVSAGGTITTFAGTGTQGFSGNGGPATSATMTYPLAVAADGQGNVYIADGHRVRKVSRRGTITTFAGGGSSTVRSAYGVAVDRQGSVYIADYVDHRVRKVSRGGTIRTFAGTGAGGYSGDGGPATSARLYGPHGIAVDRNGNVYIAEHANYTVRKVSKR